MQASTETPIHLSVAGRTGNGEDRSVSKDALAVCDLTSGTALGEASGVRRFSVGERGVLLAVAHGVDGDHGAEVASMLVVKTLEQAMAHGPAVPAPAMGYGSEALMEDAVQQAHRAVWEAAFATGHATMGAMLSAVFIRGSTAYIAEVGSSRTYLLRSGGITPLALGPIVAEPPPAGDLSSGPPWFAPAGLETSRPHELVPTLGHERTVEVALAKLELRARDCLIVCTDGLWTSISDDEILQTVLDAQRLDVATARLVERASDRGSSDHATVIAAGIGGPLLSPASSEGAAATFEVLDPFDVYTPH